MTVPTLTWRRRKEAPMPWLETDPVTERKRFIMEWLSGELAVAELCCRRHEISRTAITPSPLEARSPLIQMGAPVRRCRLGCRLNPSFPDYPQLRLASASACPTNSPDSCRLGMPLAVEPLPLASTPRTCSYPRCTSVLAASPTRRGLMRRIRTSPLERFSRLIARMQSLTNRRGAEARSSLRPSRFAVPNRPQPLAPAVRCPNVE